MYVECPGNGGIQVVENDEDWEKNERDLLDLPLCPCEKRTSCENGM